MSYGQDLKDPDGCPDRQELVDGFRAMVRGLHAKRGGVAVGRVRVGNNPCGAVVVYALGATAYQTAKAADAVQADFERRVARNFAPTIWARLRTWWGQRTYKLTGEVKDVPPGLRIAVENRIPGKFPGKFPGSNPASDTGGEKAP